MTEEKLAEEARERAEEKEKRLSLGVYSSDEEAASDAAYNDGYVIGYEEGYIDGAKAHSVQWHDLRKDPCDIPKCKGNVVLNQDGDRVTYDYLEGRWRWTDGGVQGLEMIAWCEIPEFEG